MGEFVRVWGGGEFLMPGRRHDECRGCGVGGRGGGAGRPSVVNALPHTMNDPLLPGRSGSSRDDGCPQGYYHGAEAVIPAGHEIESVLELESESPVEGGPKMRWLRIVYRPALG